MQTNIAIGTEARSSRRFVRRAILPIFLRYLMLFLLLLIAFHLSANVSKATLEQGGGHRGCGFGCQPAELQEYDVNWDFSDLLPS